MTIRFATRAFYIPKLGNALDEYEDAYACSGTELSLGSSARLALADGATMSSFAGDWARLLVDEYVRVPFTRQRMPDTVDRLQRQWTERLRGRQLPWYARQKAERGAFATFLGLSVRAPRITCIRAGKTWSAIAVGDTCLFVMRGDRLQRRFPLRSASEFGSTPSLLPSRGGAAAVDTSTIRWTHGRWRSGDRFLLMTDALAAWFLSEVERGARPWEVFEQHQNDESFRAWATRAVEEKAVRNDDITVQVMDVEEIGETATPAR